MLLLDLINALYPEFCVCCLWFLVDFFSPSPLPLSPTVVSSATRFKEKGNLAYKNKQYMEAVQHYQTALAQLEEDSSQPPQERAIIHCNLSAAYLAMTNTREAILHAKECSRLDPSNVKVLLLSDIIITINHHTPFFYRDRPENQILILLVNWLATFKS